LLDLPCSIDTKQRKTGPADKPGPPEFCDFFVERSVYHLPIRVPELSRHSASQPALRDVFLYILELFEAFLIVHHHVQERYILKLHMVLKIFMKMTVAGQEVMVG
jgi:hypothetical protein